MQLAEVSSIGVKEHPQLGKVAVIHFFSERTDGVSLQIQENNRELTRQGWDVVTCSADASGENGFRIPELDYSTPEVQLLKQHADPQLQVQIFEGQVHTLLNRLEALLEQHHPQVIHIRNLLSLPIHPAATVAMSQFIQKHPDIGFFAQHHDAYFEQDFIPGDREQAYAIPNPILQQQVEHALFPQGDNVHHGVINTLLQQKLRKRYGIYAEIVPDSFDFDTEKKEIPTIREQLGIRPHDIVIGSMARIIPRKGIEVAIQFIAELQKHLPVLVGENRGIHGRTITPDSQCVLLLPQSAGLDEPLNAVYFEKLKVYAQQLGVKIVYEGDRVVADEAYTGSSENVPFYSTYDAVDIPIFPSYQEGFGNQFLELSALADGVIAAHAYPVMQADILPIIPNEGIILLGDNTDYTLDQTTGFVHVGDTILAAAVAREVDFLMHPDKEREFADKTRRSLRMHFDSSVVGANLSKELERTIRRA